MDIINKAANQKSENFSTIFFTLIIPKFLEKDKTIQKHFLEIVFEYDLVKKEAISIITKDLKAHANLIGYPYISNHQLKMLENKIDDLIKNGKKGSYVTINFGDLKQGFDLILVRGQTTPRKFIVTTTVAENSPPKKQKKTVHRLKGTNSFGKELPKPKTRTVKAQRKSISKSPLSKLSKKSSSNSSSNKTTETSISKRPKRSILL